MREVSPERATTPPWVGHRCRKFFQFIDYSVVHCGAIMDVVSMEEIYTFPDLIREYYIENEIEKQGQDAQWTYFKKNGWIRSLNLDYKLKIRLVTSNYFYEHSSKNQIGIYKFKDLSMKEKKWFWEGVIKPDWLDIARTKEFNEYYPEMEGMSQPCEFVAFNLTDLNILFRGFQDWKNSDDL